MIASRSTLLRLLLIVVGPWFGEPVVRVILRYFKLAEELLANFLRTFDRALVGDHFCWGFMILSFPRHNLGEIYFPSPVAKYDGHVVLM